MKKKGVARKSELVRIGSDRHSKPKFSRVQLAFPCASNEARVAVKGSPKGRPLPNQICHRYDSIYNFFVSSFGPYCGWAHSILFAAAIHRKELDLKMPNTNGKGTTFL